jgi:surfeit locus 1 family protein
VTSREPGERRRRSPGFTIGLTLIALFLVTGFCALGAWQVQRLGWKRDLIARVERGLRAAPVPAPLDAGPADEYRRVTLTGMFLHDKAALTQAATIHGAGFWVLTPLRRANGTITFVNRGFVPSRKATYARPGGTVRVTGLLRLPESGGGFLRSNDPAADRWHSRDVAAIAKARGLSRVTPYFVDADAGAQANALPVAGLTVVRFPNNHLQYAITWFALAAMTVAGYILVMRHPDKDRRA